MHVSNAGATSIEVLKNGSTGGGIPTVVSTLELNLVAIDERSIDTTNHLDELGGVHTVITSSRDKTSAGRHIIDPASTGVNAVHGVRVADHDLVLLAGLNLDGPCGSTDASCMTVRDDQAVSLDGDHAAGAGTTEAGGGGQVHVPSVGEAGTLRAELSTRVLEVAASCLAGRSEVDLDVHILGGRSWGVGRRRGGSWWGEGRRWGWWGRRRRRRGWRGRWRRRGRWGRSISNLNLSLVVADDIGGDGP
mmetsp:Transcript_11635/g.13820  ORF Transcript_11635/g.13820 Transcript_11635/m.13820 type:complete len:248 (+) Transcript_11635:735-1478(+)